MRRLNSLAVLKIVLSWLMSSGEAQTVSEILSPCPRSTPCSPSEPTAAAAHHFPSGVVSAYLAIVSALSSVTNSTLGSHGAKSTLSPSFSLGSINSTVVPLLASTTSSSQPASTSTNSDDDPSTMTHIPSPVAMVAGCLAGSIVIVAALLVFFVARRRNRRRRRMLHEVMNQSWAARLAARHSVVGSVDSKDEEAAGTAFSHNTRRPSKSPSISQSTASTSNISSKSTHHLFPSSKTRHPSRHVRPSLETEDLELSSRRTSTSQRRPPSSPSPTTLLPPTVVVTPHDESDVLTPGDGRVTMGQGIMAATVGADEGDIIAADVRGALADGKGARRKLGLTHEERMGGGQGPRILLTPAAPPQGFRTKLGSEDMPPAYEYVR